MNWPLLQNSLLVASLTTLLAACFGFWAAIWLAGLEARWRTYLVTVSVIALALPPFLVTNCWLDLLGHTGVLRPWLRFDIYSLSGTVMILALLTWPITLLLVLAAWRKLEPSQLESDPALSGGALVRWLLWPMARTAVAQAAVLTFVLALNNFAVPAVLQVKVFPAELWVGFNTKFDYREAAQLSWPLLAAPLVLLLVLWRREIAWPREGPHVSSKVFRRQLGAGGWSFCGAAGIFITTLSVGLPLLQLAGSARTWIELPAAFAAGVPAVGNSIACAVATATLCVALGVVGWRLPIGWFWWLPFFTPGVLLGIALIFILNRPAFSAFYQSAGIVVLAFTVRYLALGWHGATVALRGVDRDLTDAARLEGASGWQLFRHVHWPQIAPQLAAAWYVIYLLCLWDVETLVLIVPPGGETLALRVFNLLHYGHNAQVNALCLLLLALAVAPLLLWQAGRWIRERVFQSR